MSNIINIILFILALTGVAYLLFKRMRGNKKSKHIVVIDPEAQAVYNIKKQKSDEKKSLTFEEKVELSWQFLVNLKEAILTRFSDPDKAQLNQISNVLVENGMKYEHDVEMEVKVKQELSKVKSVNKSREQETSISR